MGKPFLSFLMELAATGIMLYTQINPEINFTAALWLIIWKTARAIAHTAGRIGMRAEVRYFQTVKS